jgi:hypothetical protein
MPSSPERALGQVVRGIVCVCSLMRGASAGGACGVGGSWGAQSKSQCLQSVQYDRVRFRMEHREVSATSGLPSLPAGEHGIGSPLVGSAAAPRAGFVPRSSFLYCPPPMCKSITTRRLVKGVNCKLRFFLGGGVWDLVGRARGVYTTTLVGCPGRLSRCYQQTPAVARQRPDRWAPQTIDFFDSRN